MTHRSTIVAGLAIAAAALGAGCGSDSDSDTGTQAATTAAAAADPAADKRIADASLLTVADLPGGWKESAKDDPDNDPTCPAIDAAKAAASARAVTPDFAKGELFLDESVYVMADEAAAEKAFAAILSDETRTCLGDDLAKQLEKEIKDDTTSVGDIVTEPLDGADAGAESGGFKVIVPITVQGQEVSIAVDAAIVRVGRTLAFLSAGGTGEPVEKALVDELTVAAADRAQEALDAA